MWPVSTVNATFTVGKGERGKKHEIYAAATASTGFLNFIFRFISDYSSCAVRGATAVDHTDSTGVLMEKVSVKRCPIVY